MTKRCMTMASEKRIRLRNFKPSDSNALSDFQKETIQLNFPDVDVDINTFKKNLKIWHRQEPDGIKVLERGGEVIGYVWVNTSYNSFRKKRFGLVRHIFIRKDHRGKDFAKRLMRAAEKYLRGQGVSYIELKVTMTNTAAIGLYKALGYKEKRVIMEKKL